MAKNKKGKAAHNSNKPGPGNEAINTPESKSSEKAPPSKPINGSSTDGTNATLANHFNENEVPRPVLPFYSLRAFVDAEYSVILGYGFYKVSENLLNIRAELKNIADKPFWRFMEEACSSQAVRENLLVAAFFAVTYIMLVDDYARRRVLTALAPCRSMKRFSMDVLIGFCFGLIFLVIPYKSSGVWIFSGASFLIGSWWAEIVHKEGKQWKKEEELEPTLRDKGINHKKDHRTEAYVRHWEQYLHRVNVMISTHTFYGGLLLTVGALWVIGDMNKAYFMHTFIGYFICFILITTVHIFAEYVLAYRYHTKPEERDRPLPSLRAYCVTTVAWMPKCVDKQLERFARKQA